MPSGTAAQPGIRPGPPQQLMSLAEQPPQAVVSTALALAQYQGRLILRVPDGTAAQILHCIVIHYELRHRLMYVVP